MTSPAPQSARTDDAAARPSVRLLTRDRAPVGPKTLSASHTRGGPSLSETSRAAFELAGALGTHVPRHLRVLHFLTGAFSILLGLICFRGALESVLLLALGIGFSWLLRGTMETAAAASAQDMPARGWHVAFGIISALAGIVLIVSPFASIAALLLVVGIMAIVVGLSEVGRALMMRVEVGRLAPPPAKQRRPLFHRPHPQH
ncbi:Short repeat of unknown function [Streptomyces sp. 2112.3]|nr:short repeat uncharacterized protein DUF308 [Streptomyces sp. 2321.6]SDR01276.1 Short repeat of unknown function [Streptomyces sp. KS_16]SED83903.1 Short repeat of unknown function [Streptomyces sp. 2133.1]SED89766.1 Short repeat of unknown function [Streptomyces sp. 2112.3]SNC72833.1 Short repeat of unknown function [Streptomyces sp. 2114.4]